MGKQKPSLSPATCLLIFYLALAASPPSAAAVSFVQLRRILSLGHSLSARIADLRAYRGDLAGARRARLIADKLQIDSPFKFWTPLWSLAWDYLKNYSWRDTTSLRDVAAEFTQLLSSLAELTRLGSDSERVAWVYRNYPKLLRISNSMFNRMLSVFSKPGPVREMVEILQAEMADGSYLKDCLQVGANDFKGLVQILKELAFQSGNSPHHQDL